MAAGAPADASPPSTNAGIDAEAATHGRRIHAGAAPEITRTALAAVRVLILCGRNADKSVPSVLRIGLGGHLHKDSEPSELRSAVRRLAARDRAQLMALAGTAAADNASKEL